MSESAELVERYLATWNMPDAADRRAAIEALWSAEGAYTDPLATVRGHDGLAAAIEGAREMLPGHVFRLVGDVDSHHDLARFTWEAVPEGGGEATVIGFDVATFEQGRLRAVYGFLDKVPA